MSSKTHAANAAATGSARKKKPQKAISRPLMAGGLVALCLVAVVWYRSVVHAPGGNTSFIAAEIDGRDLNLEVADTPESRAKGVAGKTKIYDGEGMLFVFETAGNHCFWMQGVVFSIDILWFDANKKLIHRQTNVTPETYPSSFCPGEPALYVVELPAGHADAQGFDLGDVLTVENL